MCKITERLIVNRLTYEIESKGLFTPYQNGFRKGRTTMDSILCIESEIRKAQINKEVIIGVFVDVEKAYDMLWICFDFTNKNEKHGYLRKNVQLDIRFFYMTRQFRLEREHHTLGFM